MRKIAFILALFLVITLVKAEETLYLTSGEWPPYVSKDSKHFGFASHVVEQAFSKEGVVVKWGFFPWDQAFSLAEQGDWDGSIIWSKTEERERGFEFSSSKIMLLKDVFFHRKDFPFQWNSISDLSGLKIGGTTTYSYGQEFEQAEKSGLLNVQRAATDIVNFQRLMRGKIDIYGSTMNAGYVILHKTFAPAQAAQLTNHPKPYREASYHLILNKKSNKNKSIMVLFESGYKKLIVSGELEKMENDLLFGLYDK